MNDASAVARPPVDALVAARDLAVRCDLTPLALLEIAGLDATAFLNGQLSIDVNGLAAGSCRHASFNSPKGRMLATLVLWRLDAEPPIYRMMLPADIADAVRKRLSMYVLRSKVTLADVSADHIRIGIGGPRAPDAMRAALDCCPMPFTAARAGAATVLALPGPRYVVVAPISEGEALSRTLRNHVPSADFAVWRWLTIRAGVATVGAATQDAFVAQTANWDLLGGVDFNKGCYTGQEVVARMQYLGRLKERAFLFHADEPAIAAGTRLYSSVFGEQACGTVVDAAPAPGGGSDLVAVVQLAAAERGDVRLGNVAGPAVIALPLPYEIPAPAAPRGRIA